MRNIFCALTLLFPALAAAQEPPVGDKPDAPRRERRAIERGLSFLQTDTVKWRKERQCATCHHGTMTVWALCEAKFQGYPVEPATLADMVSWTKERLKDIDKPRDPRPGWNMVNSPALYLATMAQAVPGQPAVAADELRQIAGHLLRHQEADGSWAWSSAPAKNRPPPFFESDEVVSLTGVQNDRAEMRRGVAFRVDRQKDDGSWPMNRRGHPGVTPGPFSVPIIYFGSAWATLGLMRSVPKQVSFEKNSEWPRIPQIISARQRLPCPERNGVRRRCRSGGLRVRSGMGADRRRHTRSGARGAPMAKVVSSLVFRLLESCKQQPARTE